MKRALHSDLLNWKNDKKRKPLLLQGARQVGKTYLIHQFAQKEYNDLIYLNFEQNPDLKELFEGSLIPEAILENIGLYFGKKILKKDTLIFFDEIQICPKAITSLKYFYEQSPEYHIISAGSLLGVTIGSGISFPVGKVNFLTLKPMTFFEYLVAMGEEQLSVKIQKINKVEPFEDIIHNKLIDLYKLYLFIGGMPEVVKDYRDNKDIVSVRKIQNDILESYKRDFSKYSSKSESIKTVELWQSIPHQLGKENKKFKYSDVRKNGRSSAYQSTIEWLKSAGLINVAYNVSVPKLPLSGYSDLDKFKIYLLDSGLLGAMLDVSSALIISPDKIYSEYNGAFVENYVAQELSVDIELFYWTSKSDAEIDFIFRVDDEIYPLEVKSGFSRSLKSLKSYKDKYNPVYSIRVSPRNFIKSDDFMNIPLYAVAVLRDDITINRLLNS